MVSNIKDNTISEIDVKKHLNTLNIIKNSEIKHKRLIPGQKELLNLFDDLSDIILTDKTLMSSKDENEKLKEEKEKKKKKMRMRIRMRMKMKKKMKMRIRMRMKRKQWIKTNKTK